ncbi:MAG: GGDEF domain-containing protein [Candidatus Atribacteria bacterium]|nr:GGDEF domain-containing protein [Candidatus Atribacteria bacterium]
MRAGLGWSILPDEELSTKEALAQAVAGSGEPRMVFLFATPEYDAHRLVEALQVHRKAAKVLGCLSEGVIAGGKYLKKGLTMLALGGNDLEARTFASEKESGNPYAMGEELGKAIRAEGFSGGTVVILVDPAVEVPLFLQGIYNILGPEFLYLGGGTGKAQWTEKGVSSSSVSVAVLSGVDVASAADHGWVPTPELLVVTETRGKEVVEIDGVSAVEAYRERVGDFAREEFSRVGALYPLGFPNLCGRFLIRDPVYLTPDGAMGFVGARVPQGAVGYMMKGEKENLLNTVKKVTQEAVAGVAEPVFSLVFDCVSRPLILEDDFCREVAGIGEKLGGVPVCGFLSGGEIHPYGRAPVFWNKSVVVAVGGKGGQKSGGALPCKNTLEAELAILHEISALTFAGCYEEFFQELVERAVRLFAAQRMGLFWEKDGQPELVASWGFASLEDFKKVATIPGSHRHIFQFREKGMLFLEVPWEFSAREERLYTIFARKVEEVLCEARRMGEKEQRMQELEHLSLTDELTGLYNRRGFFALAEHQLLVAQREGKSVGVLLADFDGLKRINDTFGHGAGDLALSEFGQLLQKAFRRSDILARIGGDEFVAFFTDINEAEIQKLLYRLWKLVDAWNTDSQLPYSLDFSAGWAISHSSRVREVRELLTLADSRMYEKKRRKKGGNKSRF